MKGKSELRPLKKNLVNFLFMKIELWFFAYELLLSIGFKLAKLGNSNFLDFEYGNEKCRP